MAATFQYFPYDTGPGSGVKGDRWREMFSWMRSNGIVTDDIVLNTTVSDLAVVPGTGLQVKVAEGDAFIQGTFFIQTGNFAELAIAPNSSGNPRIDLIVLSADFVANTTEYEVLTGTPAMSPVAPTPTQSSILWQEPLYRLAVANGASSFITGNLTDLRVRSVQDSTGVTLTSDGGTSLVTDAIGPDLAIKGLTAGTNVTLGTSATDVTINADTVTLTSAGGTETLVNDGTGPSLSAKGLTAGTGITLTPSSTDITIAATGLASTPYCQVIATSPGTWTAGTNADMLFNTDLSDTTGMHSTSSNTNRINIATSGLYALNFTCQYDVPSAPSGNVYFNFIRTRSAAEVILSAVAVYGRIDDTYLINMSCIVPLLASDFVTMRLNNVLGGVTVTPTYSSPYTPMFSVCYVGQP